MKDTLKAGCAIVVALVLVVAIASGLAIWAGVMQFPLVQIQRQVTTQSLQYIQSHQEQLLQYYYDYQSAGDTAHQAADKTEICQTAPLLDKSQWPAPIAIFVSQKCQ